MGLLCGCDSTEFSSNNCKSKQYKTVQSLTLNCSFCIWCFRYKRRLFQLGNGSRSLVWQALICVWYFVWHKIAPRPSQSNVSAENLLAYLWYRPVFYCFYTSVKIILQIICLKWLLSSTIRVVYYVCNVLIYFTTLSMVW